MKKSFFVMVTLMFAVSIFILFLNSCNNSESNAPESSTANSTSNEDSVKKLIERGNYLAHHVTLCMDCHSERDFTQFSGPPKQGTEGMGGEMFGKELGIPGVIYAKNITSDTINGIGKWTDAEIERAITRGISKNGDTLFPLMPFAHYNGMSKGDIQSIIAYIRTIKPNSNKVPDRKLFIPLTIAYPPLQSASLDNNIKPDVSDIVKYGAYMMNSAACMDCHTPMEKGQFVMSKYMAGGRVFDVGIFNVTTPNLTPDSTTGIGSWTEEMFLEKFKHFRDAASYKTNPGKLNSMMPWVMYAGMDDFDIKAIYRYLQTIPAVNNKIKIYPN